MQRQPVGAQERIRLLLAFAGLVLLGIGIGIYLTLRPPSAASALVALDLNSTIVFQLPVAWKVLVGALPSFLHVAGFTCLSCACAAQLTARHAVRASVGWTAINVLFEIGQAVKPSLPLRRTSAYLQYGTFDSLDVLASCFGGLLAYLFVRRLLNGGSSGETF
jgi:hypothetical protein